MTAEPYHIECLVVGALIGAFILGLVMAYFYANSKD